MPHPTRAATATRSRHRLRRTIAVAAAAVATAVLAGCAPTVAMTPAAGANDPRCASVTVQLPDTVAGKKQDQTNAQATGAWGDPVAVQLRCGVKPLGPTTQPCVSLSTPDGNVDWVLESDPAAKTLTYITFGRTPAVEVTLKHGAGGVSDADVLADLAQAVSSIPRGSEKCLGAGDAP